MKYYLERRNADSGEWVRTDWHRRLGARRSALATGMQDGYDVRDASAAERQLRYVRRAFPDVEFRLATVPEDRALTQEETDDLFGKGVMDL